MWMFRYYLFNTCSFFCFSIWAPQGWLGGGWWWWRLPCCFTFCQWRTEKGWHVKQHAFCCTCQPCLWWYIHSPRAVRALLWCEHSDNARVHCFFFKLDYKLLWVCCSIPFAGACDVPFVRGPPSVCTLIYTQVVQTCTVSLIPPVC